MLKRSKQVEIFLGDCLTIMPTLPSECVDLTVTSPPYDNLRSYNGSLNDWSSAKWQAVILELYRLTKPGGVVVWIVNDATKKGSETGTSFRQALYALECGFSLHDTMIWAKDGGGAAGSKYCYTQNFEYMFVWSKGRPTSVNLLRDKPNRSAGIKKSSVGRRRASGEHNIEARAVSAEFSKRNNWWYVPPSNVTSAHPAIFPSALVKDHIASWSELGNIVFDPFLGSGTTGVVSIQSGRRFIGIERDANYFEIASRRIKELNR